ncbi:LOW QUALITY PROTEIN: zinc finger protein 576, tandem duplicate 1 [Synchiropus picturatus]
MRTSPVYCSASGPLKEPQAKRAMQSTTHTDNGPDLEGTPPAADPESVEESAHGQRDEQRPQDESITADHTSVPSLATKAAPDSAKIAGSDAKDGKKQAVKLVGKRFAPSNPLKMDMTKPVVLPLTSSELSLQCLECHIIFSDHRSKERHLKLSHPAEYEQCILRNAVFTCYVCERHFTNSTELMAHQKSHTERTPFRCPLCSQAFKRSSELTVHKKSHFGQNGYACTECGKPCKTMTLLKYHQRTHSGDRPYVCKECGLRFSFPSALHKHVLSHLPEGDPQRLGKKGGEPPLPCTVCKATFKSPKTLRRHFNSKHRMTPLGSSNRKATWQLVKHNSPVIVPINVSQPSLLQVEPNGPLQKVDSNIDTEQICRLIESLENVKKVNQLVVLGQVPPNAPPLEVQQILGPVQPQNPQLAAPPQIDFVGFKQTEQKTLKLDLSCSQKSVFMDIPLILEPITPEGPLEDTSFVDSSAVSGENEVPKPQMGPSDKSTSQVFPMVGAISAEPEPIAQLLGDGDSIDLEQTVILELTPADELEPPHNGPQHEGDPMELISTDQEKSQGLPGSESETSLLLSEQLHVSEPEGTDLPSCQPNSPRPVASEDQPPENKTPPPQSESEPNPQAEAGSDVPATESSDLGAEKEVQKKPAVEGEAEVGKRDEEAISKPKSSPKEKVRAKMDPVSAPPEIALSIMSAQELVKVRKRKPNRAYFYQEYIQELVGSMRKKDFQVAAKPAKRPKESRLVVKFGSPSAKKSKKQMKTQQEPVKGKAKTITKKKVPSPKKAADGDKKVSPATSPGKKKAPGTPVKKDEKLKEEKKKKVKKQDELLGDSLSKSKATLKKKMHSKVVQNDVQDKKVKKKKEGKAESSEPPSPHVTQESLLLLKGHKQPQLKINKLDPLKTSGPQVSDSEASPQSKSTAEPAEGQKKGRVSKKTQKALSLMSTMQASRQSTESLLGKPKPPRKRKASSKVEEEGVITSKRALECQDCGENFSDLSCLQQHKTSAHIVESPGLTYTNGNVFEGVTVCHLDQRRPKKKVAEVLSPSAGWDTEPETATDLQEQHLSFPALIPSPSLPAVPFDSDASWNSAADRADPDALLAPISDNEFPPEQLEPSRASCPSAVSGSEPGGLVAAAAQDQQDDKDNVKEDVDLQDVDLITVGEQNGTSDHGECVKAAAAADELSGSSRTSQSVRHVEIKEEEEEVSVQRSWRKRSSVDEGAESDSDCRVVNEGMSEESEPGQTLGPAEAPGPMATDQAGVDEEELRNSPGVILEKVVPAEHRAAGELHHLMPRRKKKRRGWEFAHQPPRRREIKVEEVSSRCETRESRDISSILVKEETTLELEEAEDSAKSGRMRWNVEQVSPEKTPSPCEFMHCFGPTSVENVASSVEDNLSGLVSLLSPQRWRRRTLTTTAALPLRPANQCIFYPVKQEEREIQLGDAGEENEGLESRELPETHKAWPGTGEFLTPSHQNNECNDIKTWSGGAAPDDQDWRPHQEPAAADTDDEQLDLRSFLLENSHSEDEQGVDTSAEQVDSEERVLASYYKNKHSRLRRTDLAAHSVSAEPSSDLSSSRKPIDYFSEYFGADTWEEIVNCTNATSNPPNQVTAREVAQFVGIHIAMGTLKFPSPHLYWEDLTKVPLICEAMTLSRFRQLSRTLRLASAAKDGGEQTPGTFPNAFKDRTMAGGQTDPLWKVRPILRRFHEACPAPAQKGDYAVDQHPLPLRGTMRRQEQSLQCTTLIQLGGLLSHVDLALDWSEKEAAVEKMSPKGSMLFLCQRELSTPAMLERLIAAGVYGAGRVEGDRGQIGDEFVSSDGKLMLRRSHCGFILSTAGIGRRSVASLTEHFEQAQASARLNADLRSLYSIPLTSASPRCWPLAVLWHLTDAALVNSWLVHRREHAPAPLTLMAFRLEVSKALILSSGSDTQDSVPPQPPAEEAHATSETPNPTVIEECPLPDEATRYDGAGHWPEQLAEGEGGRCRFRDCQRTSRVLCLKCCVFLCISRNHNCFLNFHHQGSLGKE